MARLQIKDLTPELLEGMRESESVEEVKEYLDGKGFEISDRGAEMIYEQIREGEVELTQEQLKAVSGGCGGTNNPYVGSK